MDLSVGILCFLLSVWTVSACNSPDCDNPDCGSCGNACCIMKFKFAESSGVVYKGIVGSLKAGGTDKQYSFVNSSDLRSSKMKDGTQYTLQATHTADEVDLINMAILSNQSDITFVQAFSISQLEGSYCDQGQNYKNLVGFIKGLAQLFAQEIVYGCSKGIDKKEN